MTFKDPQEQRKSKYRMWVKCQLVVLRGQSNQIFPVYQCEECEEMEFVSSLNINQDQKDDNDLFNFTLRYNDPTNGTALFNGNISQTNWQNVKG